MYLAVMVGKFGKVVVRERCPSTTGPLLPTVTDSLLVPGQEVLYKQCHHFYHFLRDRNKGFYSEKC